MFGRWVGDHSKLILIVALALSVAGALAATSRPVGLFPQVAFPRVQVSVDSGDRPADQMAQLVTRPIESSLAQNPNIRAPKGGDFGIKSLSMPGLSIIQVQLSDSVKDSKREFSDMNLKLNSLSLPQGAGPIKFNSDFGDTAALMLTVASPLEDSTAIAVRGYAIDRKSVV